MRKFPPLAYLQYVEHISTAYGFHEKFPAMSQFDTVKWNTQLGGSLRSPNVSSFYARQHVLLSAY